MFHVHLGRHSKRPIGGRWEISDRRSDHERWIARGHNIGLMLRENGLVVIDIDGGKDVARAFWREHRELCRHVAETRRGIHAYCEGKTATRKFPLGDIKGSGYVVSPPSVVKSGKSFWKYRWIMQGDLPRFSDYEHLFPAKEVDQRTTGEIRNARAYIGRIVAVSGQGGHNATFRAACTLRDAGVDEVDALAALVEWNQTNADPPWTAKELLHKVRSAYRKE